MGNNGQEREYEEKRLKQTIVLAGEQLKQAKEAAESKKSEIVEAKKQVRENASQIKSPYFAKRKSALWYKWISPYAKGPKTSHTCVEVSL